MRPDASGAPGDGPADKPDGNGFRGPYALALSPTRYNTLFRRYEGSDLLQLDHLSRLCEARVYKAPIEGAVVVDQWVGQINIGQDLRIGFSANDGIHYRLFTSESLVLLLDEAAAICTLEKRGPMKWAINGVAPPTSAQEPRGCADPRPMLCCL